MDPVVGGLIASGVGGIASFFGQRSANKAMLEDAKRNRLFQEKMSSTAWSRAVSDMEAAGINPAVAYSRGSASSPSGSTVGSLGSEAGEGVSSALNVKVAQGQLELLREQSAAAKAQALKTQTERRMLGVDAAFKEAEMGYYFNPNGTLKQPMIDLLTQQHSGKIANSARQVTELSLARLREPEMQAIARIFEAVGEEGKAAQLAIPLILRMLGR